MVNVDHQQHEKGNDTEESGHYWSAHRSLECQAVMRRWNL